MIAIRPWLLIGKYRETLDIDLLVRAQIGALLHLAAPITPSGIITRYLPIEDGEPLPADMLRQGVDFILAQRGAGQTVLVACGAGISRSTSFAMAALKAAEALTLREAARVVRLAHPAGLPHLALWESLCAYYQEPIDYLTLIRLTESAGRP